MTNKSLSRTLFHKCPQIKIMCGTGIRLRTMSMLCKLKREMHNICKSTSWKRFNTSLPVSKSEAINPKVTVSLPLSGISRYLETSKKSCPSAQVQETKCQNQESKAKLHCNTF